MTTLSIEDLKAWLALLPKVTPGPYEVGPRIAASWPRVYICSLADGKIVAQTKQGAVAPDQFEINAAHLAKCDPATIAALIEGYIAMAEALSTFIDEHDNTYDGDPLSEGMSVFISKARSALNIIGGTND